MIDDMAVYIANLGKYNEGYLVGAWFTFPIDEEDVKEKIGLNERYEEYAIHDTDNFPIAIGEYVSIDELNEMYEMIEELPDYIVECLDEFISHYGTLEEVVEHKAGKWQAWRLRPPRRQFGAWEILLFSAGAADG